MGRYGVRQVTAGRAELAEMPSPPGGRARAAGGHCAKGSERVARLSRQGR
jgi:hypothetical protein